MPTKPATNSARRLLVDLGGRADLLDAALVEHRDAVAHRERLALVVGDEDERDADVALDLLQLDLHLLAELEVERTERLVEEQHPRSVHERPRERDPLALSTRELVRLPVSEAARAARWRAPRRHGPAAPAFGTRLHSEPVLDVLRDGHVREQRVVLEHRVDVPVERRSIGDVGAVEHGCAPCGRSLEAGDHAQHRGLAGARRPEQREELARADVERDVVDGDDCAEPLGHAAQRDRARGRVVLVCFHRFPLEQTLGEVR